MFKVKPQNPILLIVFDAAFAKVECCRWMHHIIQLILRSFFVKYFCLGRLTDASHEIQYLSIFYAMELIFSIL